MLKIVAIGGGRFGWGTPPVDVIPLCQEIIRLSGRKHPRILFIPTAGDDRLATVEMVKRLFVRRLHCRLDTLYLLKTKPRISQVRKMVMNSDVVFVWGGNTLKMIRRWKLLGVDKVLREARDMGKVFCGPSAGGICWFRQGNSDSRKFRNPKAKLIKITGLGFIDALGCPHYDGEKDRKPELKEMMKTTPGVAIAMDNCAALEVVGNKARAITSKPQAGVYRVYWKKRKYFEERLPKGKWFELGDLTKK